MSAKKIKTFSDFIKNINKSLLYESGGATAGELELAYTPLRTAVEYSQRILDNKLYELIPDFNSNFNRLQTAAKGGRTKRKDMPVLSQDDIKKLQYLLQNGRIDIINPFADTTDPQDPFPEGLSGEEAKDFIIRGIKDGDKEDDEIKVKIVNKIASDLKPIQKQIYFDKSIKAIKKGSPEESEKYISEIYFIISSDDYIIDGHHRWQTANLINPNMKVKCVEVDLNKERLIDLCKAYGDAIGNKRNK